MSQFIQRLREELAAANEPNTRMELSGQLAAVLARSGQFEEAKAILQHARTGWGPGTLWIMLAEGIALHFEHQSADAMDRLKRALALAVSLRYSRVIALAAAWKGHFEFEACQFDLMLASWALARAHANETDLDTQARMCADIASSYFMCGRSEDGHAWFKRGHRAAVSLGDQAGVEALLYNKAALSFAVARLENCFQPIHADRLRSLRMEINSARNLNTLFRASALVNHLNLIDARLLALEGQHEQSLSLLQELRNARPFAANHLSTPYLDLEIAYLHLQQADLDYVKAYVSSQPSTEYPELDDDDQIVAAHMLARVHEACGVSDTADRCARFAEDLSKSYSEKCTVLEIGIDALLAPPAA